jgi:hypothetical protein
LRKPSLFFSNGTGLFDVLIIQGHGGSIPAINSVQVELLRKYEVVGIVADDCRMRTAGWDATVLRWLRPRPGLIYGRDGIQNERTATHPFISTSILLALGFITPPEIHNFYADNYLMAGRAHNALIYDPDLFLEHMHYSVGKSPHDLTYARADHYYAHDAPAWNQYCQSKLAQDVERIRGVFIQ